MIRSGSLRAVITLQHLQLTPNEYGEPEKAWVDYATVRADVRMLSGREYYAAQKTNAEGLVSIVIRYRDDISAKDRIVHGTDIYHLDSPPINVGNRNRRMELKCKVEKDGD